MFGKLNALTGRENKHGPFSAWLGDSTASCFNPTSIASSGI